MITAVSRDTAEVILQTKEMVLIMKKDKRWSAIFKNMKPNTEDYDKFWDMIEAVEEEQGGWDNMPKWKKRLIRSVDKEIHKKQ